MMKLTLLMAIGLSLAFPPRIVHAAPTLKKLAADKYCRAERNIPPSAVMRGDLEWIPPNCWRLDYNFGKPGKPQQVGHCVIGLNKNGDYRAKWSTVTLDCRDFLR
jgi:hypothetical protein